MDNTLIIRREMNHLESLHQFEPLLARIYAGRGICDPDELEHGLANLLSFSTLKGIESAVDLLVEALIEQRMNYRQPMRLLILINAVMNFPANI